MKADDKLKRALSIVLNDRYDAYHRIITLKKLHFSGALGDKQASYILTEIFNHHIIGFVDILKSADHEFIGGHDEKTHYANDDIDSACIMASALFKHYIGALNVPNASGAREDWSQYSIDARRSLDELKNQTKKTKGKK